MDFIKTLIRLLIFLVAIASVAILVVVGVTVITDRMRSPTIEPSVTERRVDVSSPDELVLGIYLWFMAGALDRPSSDDPSTVPFTVLPGDSAAAVADRLESAGLISDDRLLRWYMRYHGIDARLEAGEYELSRDMSIIGIAEMLQSAPSTDIIVRVVEGWRAEQIAEMLQGLGLVDAGGFMAVVRAGQFNHDFLADRPPGTSLEGYLFPDTYRFSRDATAEEIVGRMLDTFGQRIDADRRAHAVAQGLTLFEVVNLAAIVEREAVVADERSLIAAVYLNRYRQGMLLQADPTVQYGLGYQADTGQWWMLPLTTGHYSSTISDYNTYLHAGLPPGPICNPGRAAIDAVLDPADVEYLFFLAKGDGSHVFSYTFDEHLENLQRYR